MTSDEERLLFERAKQSDEAALAEIYDRYSPAVYRYLYRRLGDEVVAEDLTAQVFLQMLEAIHSHNTWETSFSGWLFRIAHNLLADHFRRSARRPTVALSELIPAKDGDPVPIAERSVTMDQLREAINHLKPDQVEVLLLRFGEGLSHAETSRILGKSEGAVKVIQFRALRALRKELAVQAPEGSFV
jgi:RNA polymerase sigma-70 factor (ECF subfamily)